MTNNVLHVHQVLESDKVASESSEKLAKVERFLIFDHRISTRMIAEV